MKLVIRFIVIVAVLLLSYFIGRPLYWEVMSRAVEGYGYAAFNLSDDKPKIGGEEVEGKLKSNKSSPERDPKKFLSHEVLQLPIWSSPSKETELPPAEAFALSKEMLEFRAKKNVIVITFANHAFIEFVLTWVKHLTDVGVFNLLVGGMDKKLVEDLFWAGVPVFDMKSGMNTDDAGWGSPVFHKMGREKVYLVNEILGHGFEVLFCDTDMVWLKNPLPYFERYPEADILISSDAVLATVADDSLESWKESYAALNIGIVHWRPSKEAMKFAAAWQHLLENDTIWDQNGFNDLIVKENRMPVDEEQDRGLFYAFDGSLKVGILPVSIFCSGHTYFVQGLYKQLGLEPYAVHTTFQFAGTEGKRHRLREAKLFLDKSDYYDTFGGFITFNPSIPEELLRGGNHTVISHFNLVNYQMKQVRDALAVALTLNRTLVMPPLWCRFDRVWFGHPGILQGTKTPQPFLCPMDHIFEVQMMLKDMPTTELGPSIDFREYSFLENSRLPENVKTSNLKVEVCGNEERECSLGPTEGFAELPINSTDEQIQSVLMPYKDVKVVEFSSMRNLFGGFRNKEVGMKLRKRVQRYTGIWCCVENLKIGHIYYDIYWDEKIGWKPLPPSRDEDDHPPFD